MPDYSIEELENRISEIFDANLPPHPAHDIHEALQIAEHMESLEFDFALKDLCPSSMTQTKWRATFTCGDMTFEAENPEAAVAICTAAVNAMRSN